MSIKIHRYLNWPAWARYFLAIVIVLAMLAVRLAIMPVEAGFAYLTFYPGIALTIFLCGVGPGVFYIVLVSLLCAYAFFPPYWDFGQHEFLLPASVGFVVSALTILGIIDFFQRNSERQRRPPGIE